MKKIILLATMPLVLFACKKEESLNNNKSPLSVAKIAGYNELNEEGQRIADAISDYNYELAITDNPNFGHYSANNSAYDIFLNGKTPSNISLKLNGNTYRPQANGQWWQQGSEFKSYIGQNVSIQLFEGDRSETFNYYIPKGITVGMLGENMTISRTGNNLTWTPDDNNLSEAIAIYYSLYDNQDVASGEGLIETNYILTEDNGSYNIDGLIADTNVKRINFIVVRGNALTFTLDDGKKLLFNIKTCDHHEYLITTIRNFF